MAEILIETCCASLEDALISAEVGIKRIELNSALPLGGLSPSVSLLEEIKTKTDLEVMVMLRPREGGMCYSDYEFKQMLLDLPKFLQAGADGIVFGILTPEATIDLERTEQILNQLEGRAAVFHRAFDLLPNQEEGLHTLIELGFERILTSGGRSTVPQGKEALVRLHQLAQDRITILPGGGLRSHNLLAFLKNTQFKEVHYTPRLPQYDLSASFNREINFGLAGLDETQIIGKIDKETLNNSIRQLSYF
ncbi:MAG: copper homeostasis protein CutC [Firmicutes bacterium]|nr:copper homeostasis protein CutC [Bacillota bacterium]